MAATPSINDSQFVTLAAVRIAAQSVNLPQYVPLVAVNYHAKSIRSSNVNVLVGFRAHAANLAVSNLQALVAVQGRPNNPKLRAWTFDLDGHQFYVLKLGTKGKTLVYDITTSTWSWWATADQQYWRATTGINWIDHGQQGYINGTNVVVGDDSVGILWVLNPEQGYDDSQYQAERAEGVQVTFDRIATAQMITRMRQFVPVHQVYLTASMGDPKVTGAYASLSYSDDIGNTYVNAGSITAIPGNYNQEFAWRSLGAFGPAGRLFQVYDNGAFARIDGLDITSGPTAAS